MNSSSLPRRRCDTRGVARTRQSQRAAASRPPAINRGGTCCSHRRRARRGRDLIGEIGRRPTLKVPRARMPERPDPLHMSARPRSVTRRPGDSSEFGASSAGRAGLTLSVLTTPGVRAAARGRSGRIARPATAMSTTPVRSAGNASRPAAWDPESPLLATSVRQSGSIAGSAQTPVASAPIEYGTTRRPSQRRRDSQDHRGRS